MGVVEENFVRVNHRTHQGYSGSSTLDMFTHLYETYTVIINVGWLAND